MPPPNSWIIPAIRRKWHKNFSGDGDIPYFEYVSQHFLKDKKNLKMLVPACGTGSQERRFITTGIISHIEGFDISPTCIKEAEKEANAFPDISFHYQVANADEISFE